MSMSEGAVCLLQPLGLLGIRGPDTLPFLQGQLSADVTALPGAGTSGTVAGGTVAGEPIAAEPAATAPRRLLRAGLHNPQGRTLALLGLVATGADSVLALLPRELVGPTRATLQRYVLRSKVSLHDESDTHRIYGLTGRLAASAAAGGGIALLHEGARQLRIVGAADFAPQGESLSFSAWHAADIAAGLPQVYAATSGQFVAQMLNLDSIGAVSFTKGCYTGQEVIARAHYRGRVKRRMHRYLSREPVQLAPGDSGEFNAGGSFRVVDSVQQPDGRCEFLAVVSGGADTDAAPGSGAPDSAVAPLARVEPDPAQAATQADARAPAPAGRALRIDALELPLPYALPA